MKKNVYWEKSSLSHFDPIWGNKDFDPGKNYHCFKQWALKGIQKIGDLFKGGTLMPFIKLRDEFGIPTTNFFKYLQVCNYIRVKQHSVSRLLLTELEKVEYKQNYTALL